MTFIFNKKKTFHYLKNMDAEAYLKLGDMLESIRLCKCQKILRKGNRRRSKRRSIGNFFLLGNGVEQDYGKAKEYYEKSAQEDYPKAFAKIGYLYAKGKGVEVDFGKAIEFLEKGISKGDAESMHNLGELYFCGTGVEKDVDKALELFKAAAKKKFPRSYFCLGHIYAYGEIVDRDTNKSLEYFAEAASLGDQDAIEILSLLINQ